MFRIMSMLLIIMHHYVVNSGLSILAHEAHTLSQSVFLMVFGSWGKTGINGFVLITGYFMCKSQISVRKFIKLFFEIEFYNIAIYIIFLLSGYTAFSPGALATVLFPVTYLGSNFVGCYLIFYCCIPFLNVLIANINEKMHIRLILLCLFAYTALGTLSVFGVLLPPLNVGVTMNYVSWFIVLYFIAAYFRCYPKAIFNSKRFWGGSFLFTSVISIMSVAILTYFTNSMSTYFVADSNKILAVVTAVCAFLFFKNLHLGNYRWINVMGASTFGVLMIHANSDTMRQWLWRDLLRNPKMFSSPWLPVHAVLSVLGIFIICVLVDQVRIRFVEKSFFKWWDMHYSHWAERFCELEKTWCTQLHIEE